MNAKNNQSEFNMHFNQLRKIINSWELIPGAPIDEFDALNHKVLSQLIQGTDFMEIKKVIEHELTQYYGLVFREFNSQEIINQISEWWINK